MKTISIIIPHYNSWEYLKALLKTIPNCDSIEIIVVDDHSDNFLFNKSIIELNFNNVTLLQNLENKKGAGAARNVGLSQASGDWILFADADDKFTENAFTNIQDFLDSDFDLIYFTPTSFKDGTDEIGDRHTQYSIYIKNYLEHPSEYNELKMRYYFLVPWSKLIRGEIIKNNNINFEEIEVSNDIYFSASIGFFAKNMTVIDKQIYSIRESSNSLTANMSERKFKIRFRAWVDYIIFLQSHLDKEKLKLLGISSMPQLYIVYRNKLGIKNILFIIHESIKNNIPIFNWRLLRSKFLE